MNRRLGVALGTVALLGAGVVAATSAASSGTPSPSPTPPADCVHPAGASSFTCAEPAAPVQVIVEGVND